MSEGVVSTTKAERDRAFAMRQCVEGGVSQGDAAERLGIGFARSSG